MMQSAIYGRMQPGRCISGQCHFLFHEKYGDNFLQPVAYCNIQCIHQNSSIFQNLESKKSFCESSVYDRSVFDGSVPSGSHFL